MRDLYPEIAPFSSFTLDVDASHRVYVEEVGTRGGLPVIFLHGGPGSGSNENHRRYFDPSKYHVVLFDQRGCHRSSPRGETRNNTTQFLIEDIERIRLRLGMEKWLVFGGSWGAALGLLYAQRHPGHVLGLILRGVFLARQRDLDWFARDGANRIFPDHWAEFVEGIPEQERMDLIGAYYSRLHGVDEAEKLRAARAWSKWAGRVTSYLLPDVKPEDEDRERVVHEVSIETHYAKHRYFIAEDQILKNTVMLPRVPIRIVHGRRDLTCTLDASWELHACLPGSELTIVDEGGHLAGEPVMTDALVAATDELARRLS